MKSSVRTCVAALSVLLILAPACGGDEKSGGDGKSSGAAKTEFIKQAGAICEGSNKDFNALFDTDFPTLRSKTAAFFSKAVPILEDRNSKLKDLKAPQGDEDEVSSMLESADKTVEDFKRASQDEQLASDLFTNEGGDNSVAFENKADEYGIAPCATDEGGDEDEQAKKVDISGFSPEKKAYIEKVDAICKSTDDKFAPVEEEMFSSFPPTAQAWKDGLPKLLAIYKPGLEEIKAVTPPSADKPAIDSILEKESRVFEALEQARVAADAGDEAKLDQALKVAFPLFDEIDAQYRAFGFQVCGSEDSEEEQEEG